MSRNGGGSCELSVAVHTSHGICHTVGCRACSHIVRMKGTACAAAGSNGEVLLACLEALLLVGACDRMLEAGRVGGVSGDGNINVLMPHDGNAFLYIVGTVAVNLCARAVRILGIAGAA